MHDRHLSNIEKLEKKKIWCYSFNLSTSPKRRRLQYTYFGTVQAFIKLIWDGPTKGKILNFWGPITKGGKKLLVSPGLTTNQYKSHYTMSFNKVLKHFSNILRGLARGIQIFCFLHFCDVAEVAIIHKTV